VEGVVANCSGVHKGTNLGQYGIINDEQSYRFKLQAYQTSFLDFKYKPPSLC
jgi:hypothetical protein